jgi:hypothetical protein
MKLITINVEDDEHTAIKLAATKAGLSIKDYLLNPKESPRAEAELSPVKKAQKDYESNKLRYATKSPTFAPNTPRLSKSKVFLCGHGFDPKFCKHAKPGRPCK